MLAPLPIIQTPFNRIAMDFISPLTRTGKGACYLLVIMDYAARYTEAVPMRNIMIPTVTWLLTRFFMQVGMSWEILRD